MPRRELVAHEFSCSKAWVNCAICGERVRRKDLSAHNRKMKAMHLLASLSREARSATELVAKQVDSLHRFLEGLSGRVGTRTQQRVLGRNVVWELGDAESLPALFPGGRSVESSPFSMGGIGGCSFLYYPNGQRAGCVHSAIYVKVPAVASYRLTVNAVSSHVTAELDLARGKGWEDVFPISAEASSSVTIRLEVFSATPLLAFGRTNWMG